MQHATQLEVIADLWGGRITHVFEASVSYSSILNLCPSVLRLYSSTSWQTVLDFTFHASHSGLVWVCQKTKAPTWFCQLTEPECQGSGLFAGSGKEAIAGHHLPPQLLWATAGCKGREVLEGIWAGDMLKWQRVVLWQAGAHGSDIMLRNEPKSISQTAQQQHSGGSSPKGPLILLWYTGCKGQKGKSPATSFREWKWTTGPSQRASTRLRKQEVADDWQRVTDSFKPPRLVDWTVSTAVEKKEEILEEPEGRMKDK